MCLVRNVSATRFNFGVCEGMALFFLLLPHTKDYIVTRINNLQISQELVYLLEHFSINVICFVLMKASIMFNMNFRHMATFIFHLKVGENNLKILVLVASLIPIGKSLLLDTQKKWQAYI